MHSFHFSFVRTHSLSLIAPGVNHTSNENIRCPVISFYNIAKETLDNQSLAFITALSDVQLEVDSVAMSNLFSAKLQRIFHGNKKYLHSC